MLSYTTNIKRMSSIFIPKKVNLNSKVKDNLGPCYSINPKTGERTEVIAVPKPNKVTKVKQRKVKVIIHKSTVNSLTVKTEKHNKLSFENYSWR